MCRGLEMSSNAEGQTKLVITQEACETCGNEAAQSLDFILDPAEAVDFAMGIFNHAAPHLLVAKAEASE